MAEQKGKIHEVYFEELRENGQVAGRSFSNFLVSVNGSEELLGKTKKVLVEKTQRMVLYGRVTD